MENKHEWIDGFIRNTYKHWWTNVYPKILPLWETNPEYYDDAWIISFIPDIGERSFIFSEGSNC